MEMSSIEYVAGLVEMTNFFSLATVLLCFLCMVIFILRLSADQWADNIQHARVLPCQKMQPVSCPITLHLLNHSSSNYGVAAQVHFSCNGTFQSFWGVDVKKLSEVMCLEWTAFRKAFMDESLLEGFYFHKNNQQRMEESNNSIKMNLFRESSSYRFGDYNGLRTRYPLVVIQILKNPSPASVVCLITVIHIQDPKCALESQILIQYVRTMNSKFIQLTPMFMSRSMEAEPGPRPVQSVPAGAPTSVRHRQPGKDTPAPPHAAGSHAAGTSAQSEATSRRVGAASSNGATQQEAEGCELLPPECVVCQTAPVGVVMLPCRHGCVCDACFARLTVTASGYVRCPLCRTFISSFFRLSRPRRDRRGGDDGGSGHRLDQHSPSLYTRLMHFNDKLNRLFGVE